MKRLFVFDMDDTLYPEHQFVMSGFRAVSDWAAENLGIGDFFDQALELFNNRKRKELFNNVLSHYGYVEDEMLVKRMVEVYRTHSPSISLCDDAKWALEHHRSQGPLALITDGYLQTQRNKVAALEVAPYFDLIVYSDSLGRKNWKPSPAPYQKVMDHFNLPGSVCTYVGDNPTKDFVTAKTLGWSTVHIQRKGGVYSDVVVDESHQANRTIYSLRDL
jgi:putative hydrolase of the HAD superfamily